MKRPSYFIAARPGSGDTYGADLVLALREEFPKVEVVGICGTKMLRARVSALLTLDQTLRFHSGQGIDSLKAKATIDQIREVANEFKFQLAILVGYSLFQERLAKLFADLGIPVILYGLTPGSVFREIDRQLLKRCVTQVIAVLPTRPAIYDELQLPFAFYGSPVRDRINKVGFSRQASVLRRRPESKLVVVLPGTDMKSGLAQLAELAATIKQLQESQSGVELVVTLPEDLRHDVSAETQQLLAQLFGPENTADESDYCYEFGPVLVYYGMSLELMQAADVVVAGGGGSSLECCLLGTPCIAYLSEAKNYSADRNGYRSLANQILGDEIALEYAAAEKGSDELLPTIQRLLACSAEESARHRAKVERLQDSMPGMAVETVAKAIGDLAGWSKRKTQKGNPATVRTKPA